MNHFLKYNDINYYKNHKIGYNCFNYKDCLSKKKEYEFINDLNDIPINLKKLAYIEVLMNRKNIELTTPPMMCLFGFNKETNHICLQFSNYKDDEIMNEFFNFIQRLEYSQMEYLGLSENNCNLYSSQIKYDKSDKYEPYLNVKVPFRYNRYEVELKNKENDNLSIFNLYNFTKVQCDIYIDKIWKFNGKYICKWKLKRLRLV
tara:strand:- start:878 stop:1486 length:609 start_codon:yes stop_codon:yes gene_type:complete